MKEMIYRTNAETGRNGRPEYFVYRDDPRDGYVVKCFEHVDGWVVLDGLRGSQRALKMSLRTADRAAEVAMAIVRHATAVNSAGCLTFDQEAVRRDTHWY